MRSLICALIMNDCAVTINLEMLVQKFSSRINYREIKFHCAVFHATRSVQMEIKLAVHIYCNVSVCLGLQLLDTCRLNP